jgi:hypothetical protein
LSSSHPVLFPLNQISKYDLFVHHCRKEDLVYLLNEFLYAVKLLEKRFKQSTRK